MRRLAEREIAQADASAAETNDGRDRTRALRARHDRLRCLLLAALPAEMASAAFVSRLELLARTARLVAARRRSYELLADAFGLSGARDAEPELAHAQDIHDRSSHRE